MKIAVIGLWHLGCVTAGCLAKIGHEVVAYDPNPELIQKLQQGISPIFEPGLDDLLLQTKSSESLRYTSDPKDLAQAEIALITFDTPVDDHDIADTAFVLNETKAIFPHLASHALVLVSSQVPVGSTRCLQEHCASLYSHKMISFGCLPENLRLGKAIDVFMHPDRFIVGLQNKGDQEKVETLLSPITSNIVWMSIESAEMTKHALNAFLATSVVFINELSSLCEQVGANAYEVEMGLKSEERIGKKAYLKPGGAIGGGTLLRDVNYLNHLNQQQNNPSHLMSALLESNQHHKEWLCRKVMSVLSDLKNKTIAVLGLTYKPNTNTLRRSNAVETSRWLHEQGAIIKAFDPMINVLPADLAHFIQLQSSIPDALQNADALIIATEWPQFCEADISQWLSNMKKPIIFDPSSFLIKTLTSHINQIDYYAIGRSA